MGDNRNTPPGGESRARLTCRRIARALFGRAGGTNGTPHPDPQQHYRDVYENATEGIFRAAPDGRFLSANPAMVALMGDADEAALLARLTGVDRQPYADPSQRDEFARLLRVNGAVEQFEAEVVRADGTRAWHSISARVEHDEAGRPLYVDGTVRDVSERKRAEADLRRTAAAATAAAAEARKLSLVVSRTHNPVVVADAQGRVEWANGAFLKLTGYALSELVGQDPMAVLSGPRGDTDGAVREVRDKLAAGEPFEAELLRYAKDGRPFWLALDVEPLRDEGGVVRQFIANLEDVTDRRRGRSLDHDRRHLLERVARHEPVGSTLAAVCDAVGRQWDAARAAVVRYDVGQARARTETPAGPPPPDGPRWWTAAAPRLSAAFVLALDAALADPTGPFAPDADAVPTEVAVADVSADPRWSTLAAAAAAEGVVACRSVPILGGGGVLLGRLVVLLGTGPADASADEPFRRATNSLAGLAALAIEHQQLTDRLARQAMHDPLTGLPNRARLDAILPAWLSSAARAARPLGVLMIDLDGFKHVNDTLGHAAGDALLVQVAGRLAAAAREGDVLVRMGGDEFTLVATDLAGPRDAGVVAGRLITALSAPFPDKTYTAKRGSEE